MEVPYHRVHRFFLKLRRAIWAFADDAIRLLDGGGSTRLISERASRTAEPASVRGFERPETSSVNGEPMTSSMWSSASTSERMASYMWT